MPGSICAFPQWENEPLPRYAGACLASAVAQGLDAANIPNLLWGRLAMNVLGAPGVSKETQFIIPDDLMQAASDILSAAGLTPCAHGTECPDMTACTNPTPDVHFHMVEDDPFVTLDLYKKSNLLWAHPPLETKEPSIDDSTYILANDPRHPRSEVSRGSGRFPDSLYPVKVLTKAATVEALILLCCHHFDLLHSPGNAWLDALCDMSCFVMCLEDQGDLDPRVLPFFRAMHEGEGEPYDILRDLREDLLNNHEHELPFFER